METLHFISNGEDPIPASTTLGVLPNSHSFESSQGHLPKAKPYAYRGTHASKVLRVPLGLVEMRISTES